MLRDNDINDLLDLITLQYIEGLMSVSGTGRNIHLNILATNDINNFRAFNKSNVKVNRSLVTNGWLTVDNTRLKNIALAINNMTITQSHQPWESSVLPKSQHNNTI